MSKKESPRRLFNAKSQFSPEEETKTDQFRRNFLANDEDLDIAPSQIQWNEMENSIGSVDDSTAGNLLEVYNELKYKTKVEDKAPIIWPSAKKNDQPIAWLSKATEIEPEEREQTNSPKVFQSNRVSKVPVD